MRVPWTARRPNQSIRKEINPQYSLEGLLLKLKLQDLRHLVQRADSLERTLMLAKIEGKQKSAYKETVNSSAQMLNQKARAYSLRIINLKGNQA